MSLFALVLVGLLSAYFWRQLVAALLAGIVLLVVVGLAFVLQAAGPAGAPDRGEGSAAVR